MPDRVAPSREDALALARKLSNENRWGAEDQIGTLNLITPQARVGAAAEVQSGEVISLAIELNSRGPQVQGNLGRFNPVHLMVRDGGDIRSGAIKSFYDGEETDIKAMDDMIIMPLQAATHWDGLGHVLHGDRMYNGFGADDVSSLGARRNGIERAAASVIGRGVLLDLPRLHGRDWLDRSEAIHAEDLQSAVDRQGVEIRSGDILLVRTGQLAEVRAAGTWGDYAGGPAPGLMVDTLEWIAEHEIAAVASDTYAVEVRPDEIAEMRLAFHVLAIPYMGLTLGELFDLEQLGRRCDELGRYSFLFAAPPLPITGAVGSPINPLAVF